MSGRERDSWCGHSAHAHAHALTCARRCACCGAARCPHAGPAGGEMEEGGYWRPSCSTLSLHHAEHHGSATHLCARHRPPPPTLRHAPHHAHAHAHSHAHHVPQHQHATSCPVHSPFRQPTPEYCAAHSQVCFNTNKIERAPIYIQIYLNRIEHFLKNSVTCT